jgi:hypothetical protein
MPFVGYIILFQNTIIHIISSLPLDGATFSQDTTSTIGFGFYFIYFGLSLFGVGSFIFILFCDLNIKRHADSASFCLYCASTTTLEDIMFYCNKITEHFGLESTEGKKARVISQSISTGVQSSLPIESRLFVQKSYFLIKDQS